LIRNFIIGSSILLFVLSGIITYKALGIPGNNPPYKNDLKGFKSNNLSSESEAKSIKNRKESAADEALIKELQAKIAILEQKISDKNMETQKNSESRSLEQHISDDIKTHKDMNLSKELLLSSHKDTSDISTDKLKIDSQYASRTVYTIQIGSLNSLKEAEEHFDSIVQALNENELDLLRIEKIGKDHIHTVRLGKFENYKSAKKLLQAIQAQIPDVIILKAYIKNERIVRLYGDE
jgi:hypothetical protein